MRLLKREWDFDKEFFFFIVYHDDLLSFKFLLVGSLKQVSGGLGLSPIKFLVSNLIHPNSSKSYYKPLIPFFLASLYLFITVLNLKPKLIYMGVELSLVLDTW